MVVDLEVGCVRLKFGFVSSSLIEAGGGLVCESVGKADMLSVHFDGKQSRDPVDLPSVSRSHNHAFRSREVKLLLLDLDSYCITDPLGMFPLFLMKLWFWPLVLLWYFGGSFVWEAFLSAGEWLISPQFHAKGPPSSSASNYRPISLTPILSNFFVCLVSVRLGVLWKAEVCFQPPSSLIGKVLAIVMPFFVWHTPYRMLWR